MVLVWFCLILPLRLFYNIVFRLYKPFPSVAQYIDYIIFAIKDLLKRRMPARLFKNFVVTSPCLYSQVVFDSVRLNSNT